MTAVSTLSFKCALITGGGGIGAKAYYVLDVSNTSSISSFIKEILSKHPELDCLINNAGVQRPFQILGPDYGFDLNNADQEIDTNIRGPLHLSVGLVPHFNSLPNGGVIMNVSSVLGYNPFSIVNPVYNGTKSWLHFFTMNLRTQLRDAGSRIKVVEIVPPTVETALHRERKDPDDNKKAHGNEGALSVEEFMEQVVEGWKENRDVCAAGMGHEVVEKWYEAYGEAYSKAGG